MKSAEGLRHDYKLTSPVSTAAVRGTTFDYDGVNLDVEDGVVLFTDANGQGGTVGQGEGGTSTGDGEPQAGENDLEDDFGVNPNAGRTAGGRILDQPPPATGTLRILWTNPGWLPPR